MFGVASPLFSNDHLVAFAKRSKHVTASSEGLMRNDAPDTVCLRIAEHKDLFALGLAGNVIKIY